MKQSATILLILSIFLITFTGCTVSGRLIIIPEPVVIETGKDVVVIHKRTGAVPRNAQRPKETIKVPRGHMPPKGMCRMWYHDRPPGHQPPAVSCRQIRRVPSNARVIRG